MIICHKHKFIFIKTRKTAGTSIETALAKFCDDDDVITALSDEDEQARRESGIRSAQNLLVPISRYRGSELRQLFGSGRTRFSNHTPASDVSRFVARRMWDEYFVFCVERNPFDHAISQYHWKNRKRPDNKPPMPVFLRDLSDLNISNWTLYTENNEVTVDRIIRYEKLEEGLNEVSEQLGIRIDISGIHAKAWTRADKRKYSEVIDHESRLIIENRCAREIEYFGYQWTD